MRLSPTAINPALLIMGANWVGYGANAISLLVSARILGAEGRGAYSALLVWSMTSASVCDLSLGPALARALTVGYRPDQLRRFLTRAFLMASFAAIALVTVFLNTFLQRSVPDRYTVPLTLSIAPALMLAAWGVYFFQGMADQVRYALARMLPPLICLLMILAQAPGHLTLDGALASLSISYWVVGGWSAIGAWRQLARSTSRPAPEGSLSLFRYALRAHPGTLASIASARLDLLLLSLIVPLATVGNYALAVSLTAPIAIVGSGLAAANFRRIGSISAEDEIVVRTVWQRFFAPTVGLACVSGAAAFLIPHLVGHQFEAAMFPTLILAAGSCGLGAIYLGTNMLQARGRPGTASLLSLAAGLVAASTLLLLVPRYGIVGAALSSAVTYLLVGGSCLALTLRGNGTQAASAGAMVVTDLLSGSQS